MNMKLMGIRNIALMLIFAFVGLTQFTENMRPVQIVGLFVSGAVFGASLVSFISALRSKRKIA